MIQYQRMSEFVHPEEAGSLALVRQRRVDWLAAVFSAIRDHEQHESISRLQTVVVSCRWHYLKPSPR